MAHFWNYEKMHEDRTAILNRAKKSINLEIAVRSSSHQKYTVAKDSYGKPFYVKSLLVSAGPPLFCSRPPAVFRQVPRCFQQVTRCFSAGHLLLYSRGPAVVAAGDCYTS
jgi:hypothetical protein